MRENKQEKWKDFSEEEKQRAFDKIADCYFYKNFGTLSKTDLETLLFSKLFQCRADIFIDLCRSLSGDNPLQLSQEAKNSLKLLEEQTKDKKVIMRYV